jgi:hypothetical protein
MLQATVCDGGNLDAFAFCEDRPSGSRNLLGQQFVAAVSEDWTKHGATVLAKVRNNNPSAYLRVVASLVSRDEPTPTPNPYDGLTRDELIAEAKKELATLANWVPTDQMTTSSSHDEGVPAIPVRRKRTT